MLNFYTVTCIYSASKESGSLAFWLYTQKLSSHVVSKNPVHVHTSQIPGSKNKQQKGKKSFKKPEYINEDELESDSDIAR